MTITMRCACGAGTLGDSIVHREGECVPMTVVYEGEAEAEAYPAPEVSSRDPWDGTGAPDVVVKLAERAVAALWGARVQRSRGSRPHALTGAPGVVKWRYAVVLTGGEGGSCAYAVHDSGEWESVMLWSATRSWFPHASITDLAGYIDTRGDVDDAWFDAIRARLGAQKQRRADRKLCDRGEHVTSYHVMDGGVVTCSLCGHDVGWRKVVSGNREGAR